MGFGTTTQWIWWLVFGFTAAPKQATNKLVKTKKIKEKATQRFMDIRR